MVNVDSHRAARPLFAFSRPPVPGESLMGFVARNAEIHGVQKLSTALKPAGIWTNRPGFLPLAATEEDVAGMSRAFGAEHGDIRARCHAPIHLSGRPHNAFVDFFGTPIRAAYIETRRRRVAPSALRSSPHHRDLWNLRVFDFCPETGERLIDACPACGNPLGWTWTESVGVCETCRAELASFPQPVVDGFGAPGLGVTTELVNPAMSGLDLPDGVFGDATRGDVFEFCLAVARTLDACRAGTPAKSRVVVNARAVRPVPAADLAFAGAAVSGWKTNGLAPMIDFARRMTDERGGTWGGSDEFIHVRNLSRDPYLHPSIRDACAEALADSTRGKPAAVRFGRFRDIGTLVTARGAAEYGITREMVRRWRADGLISAATNPDIKASVVVIRRDEVEAIAAERDAAVDRAAVSLRLGVDAATVIRIAALGLIVPVERPVADMLVNAHYRGCGVDAFIAKVEALAVQPTGRIVPLFDAVANAAGDDDRLLAGALIAALAGSLTLYRLAVGSDGVLGRLAVSTDVDVAKFLVDAPVSAYEGVRFSGREARQYLKASLNTITALIAEGELRDTGRSKEMLDFVDVEAFRRRHALTNEVAQRLGVHPVVAINLLRARGLAPARTLANGKMLWNRDEIERVIGLL